MARVIMIDEEQFNRAVDRLLSRLHKDMKVLSTNETGDEGTISYRTVNYFVCAMADEIKKEKL